MAQAQSCLINGRVFLESPREFKFRAGFCFSGSARDLVTRQICSRPNSAEISHPMTASPGKAGRFLAMGFIALAVLPYLQTLHHDFVNYDDNLYVTENPHVLSGLSWHGIVWAFTTLRSGNWHPLTWLSHMLDVTIWDGWAGGHHLTSVVLHAADACLLFS